MVREAGVYVLQSKCVTMNSMPWWCLCVVVKMWDNVWGVKLVFVCCSQGVGQCVVCEAGVCVLLSKCATMNSVPWWCLCVAVKVWDNVWCVKMVFVGHSQSVSSLAIYPHGPLFISASRDCTIRVWSMETCDEVDK